jgi:hypothetical protein
MHMLCWRFRGEPMSLGSDLLNLRRNKTSSVLTLLSGIERLATARSGTLHMTRAFALNELGDAVLANVAVHAAEAYWGDIPLRKPRRGRVSSRSKSRRFDSLASSYQRRLFA